MEFYNKYFPIVDGETVVERFARYQKCHICIIERCCTYRVTFAPDRKAGMLTYESGIKNYTIEWVRVNGSYRFFYNEENAGKTHNEPTMTWFLDKLFK